MLRILIVFTLTALLLSCSNDKQPATKESTTSSLKERKVVPKDFLYLESGEFKLNGAPFFPKMMNYIASLSLTDGQYYFRPSIDYDSLNKYEGRQKADFLDRMDAHFQLISEMGFNTIRLSGLDIDYEKKYPNGSTVVVEDRYRFFYYELNNNYEPIINAYKEVLNVANNNGLKVLILLPFPRKTRTHNQARLDFLRNLFRGLSNESTLIGYDFFNEPLYFDRDENINGKVVRGTKCDAIEFSKNWRKLMDNYAPHQLITIGLSEPIEAFRWDANLLDVDFVSMHTYHPLRVPGELHWYKTYVNKPMIIGETGLPADNDSISYEHQKMFMNDVLTYLNDCAYQGFGWWQFQDVTWGPFEHNYTPMLNHDGYTITKKGDTIYGTLKPAVEVIKNFVPQPQNNCKAPINYYNLMGYDNYLHTMKLVDADTEEPIEGAVIRGWTADWSIGLNTFSDEEGNVTLYSNEKIKHLKISALDYEMITFREEFEYEVVDDSPLENVDLEYQSIHYTDYLLNDSNPSSLFTFDTALFFNHKRLVELGTIELNKFNLESCQ